MRSQIVSARISVLVRQLGPYHVARLQALAARLGHDNVAAVETSDTDDTYEWARLGAIEGFAHHRLFDGRAHAPHPSELWPALQSALDRVRPGVLAVPGWSDPLALAGMAWARRRHVPIVLMSDSRVDDAPRTWWRETIKAKVVRLADAAFVAGAAHASYIISLGMPAGAIVTGYDVVDNAHFAAGAAKARAEAVRWRQALGLPERYFLASNRFVAKKNLPGLLRAYAGYRQRAGEGAWSLVMLGDGPLRQEVEELSRALGLGDWVSFAGFQQYDRLPVYYGLAQAFVQASSTDQWGLVVNEAMAAGLPVLVSRRCGCAEELVIEGGNGWTFDPNDELSLAERMFMVSNLSTPELQNLAEAGQRHIAQWSPEYFAAQLETAAAKARSARRRACRYDQFLLWQLARHMRGSAVRRPEDRIAKPMAAVGG